MSLLHSLWDGVRNKCHDRAVVEGAGDLSSNQPLTRRRRFTCRIEQKYLLFLVLLVIISSSTSILAGTLAVRQTKTTTDQYTEKRSIKTNHVVSTTSSSSVVFVAAAAERSTVTSRKQKKLLLQRPRDDDSLATIVQRRVTGIFSLFSQRPYLFLSASLRVLAAMALEFGMDAFLKGIVTPLVVATGIGAAVAPLTFLLEYSLQPIIHSVAFIVFDDSFLLATLETTGIKDRLLLDNYHSPSAKGLQHPREWHKLSFIEGFCTRYVIKFMASWCMGWAGLLTIVPVLGQVLSAALTGWVVAWDYVYVPLSGMHHVGPWEQFKTVWAHRGAFQWYGFWAVLMEELPFVGPSCHVYNVYSAAFFLEQVFILQPNKENEDDDATVSTMASEDSSFYEL